MDGSKKPHGFVYASVILCFLWWLGEWIMKQLGFFRCWRASCSVEWGGGSAWSLFLAWTRFWPMQMEVKAGVLRLIQCWLLKFWGSRHLTICRMNRRNTWSMTARCSWVSLVLVCWIGSRCQNDLDVTLWAAPKQHNTKLAITCYINDFYNP